MHKLKKFLKTYKWWDSKLSLMMAFAYYELSLAAPAPPLGKVLVSMALFYAANIGIAGFGHLLNDLCDVEQDRRTGANNLVASRNRGQAAVRFGFVLIFSWLPWRWLPTSPSIWALLTLEYSLFFAYCVRPLRLKERGLFGVVADALYAFTIPLSYSTLVYARLGNVIVPLWFGAVIVMWAIVVGLRGIMTHQIEDCSRDQLSGTKTFVTIHGWRKTLDLLHRVLLPWETLAYLLLLLALSANNILVPIGFALFVCWEARKLHISGIWQTANPWRLPVIDKLFFLTLTVMTRFYTGWLPLLNLAGLVMRQPKYIVLLAIHLVLFDNGLKTIVRYELPELRRRLQFA